MIRLTNDSLSRALHLQLYNRMMAFCQQYSTEVPPNGIIEAWLSRLFAGDTNLHILINDLTASNLTITEHAVIDVQHAGQHTIIVVHQCQHDVPSLAAIDELSEYADKLAAHTNAYSLIFFTAQHSKAFQKRYGYTTARSMMVKLCQGHNDSDLHDDR